MLKLNGAILFIKIKNNNKKMSKTNKLNNYKNKNNPN